MISSVLAIIIAGVINYYFVKEHNNKIVNDSLAKARKVKKEKAEKRKEEEKRSGDVNFSPGKNKNFSPGENKDFSPGENKELEIINSKIKN